MNYRSTLTICIITYYETGHLAKEKWITYDGVLEEDLPLICAVVRPGKHP